MSSAEKHASASSTGKQANMRALGSGCSSAPSCSSPTSACKCGSATCASSPRLRATRTGTATASARLRAQARKRRGRLHVLNIAFIHTVHGSERAERRARAERGASSTRRAAPPRAERRRSGSALPQCTALVSEQSQAHCIYTASHSKLLGSGTNFCTTMCSNFPARFGAVPVIPSVNYILINY